MKKTIVVLTAAAVLIASLATDVAAKSKKKHDKKDSAVDTNFLIGSVVKVDEKGVITVKIDDNEMAVATNEKTAVTINDKDAQIADLVPGMTVTVRPAAGTATRIDATTAKLAKKKPTSDMSDYPLRILANTEYAVISAGPDGVIDLDATKDFVYVVQVVNRGTSNEVRTAPRRLTDNSGN